MELAYLITLPAIYIVVTSLQLPLMHHSGGQVIQVSRFVDLARVWLGRVGQHVDRQRKVHSPFHFLGNRERVLEALVTNSATLTKANQHKSLTFNCMHKIAGNFLIFSCLVAFCGVPPQPLQLYTSAMSFSGDVKLSKQPFRVGVDDPRPPSCRFLACTWTSRLRSTIGSSVCVTLPHLSQVTLLRILP